MNPNPENDAPKAAATNPAANAALNALLHDIDSTIQRVEKPETQMGVLMLAQALVFRRLLDRHGATQRNARLRFVRLAVEDFERKLRQYGVKPPASEEPGGRM